MLKKFTILLASALSLQVHAQQSAPPDWAKVKPVTTISVSTTEKVGVYKISAVITDALTGVVVAKPVLLAGGGAPSTVEFGTPSTGTYRFIVTVDENSKSAAFRSEVLKGGVIESAHAGVLIVGSGY